MNKEVEVILKKLEDNANKHLTNQLKYWREYQDYVLLNYIKNKDKEIDRLQNIINELEKDLEEFDFTALICGNRKVGKSIELGARLNNDFILDKLKELKENNNG